MLRNPPKLPVQQLIILSICRLAEPVVMTSVLPYFPEMVEYVGVPKNDVAKWVGIASAVTPACQAIMAVPWSRLSDYLGRKAIILWGLSSIMIFQLIFGFSQTLSLLVVSRCFLGFVNGNVGIMRTMVAEMVPEKELQPRAFSLMPMAWTIGSIFGPAMGGALACPAHKHPHIFGGSEFFKKYPFALPNIVSALIFIVGIVTGALFLKETLKEKKGQRDYGLVLGQLLTRPCTGRRRESIGKMQEDETTALLGNYEHETSDRPQKPSSRSSSWKEIFSPQSSLILVVYAMISMHAMSFDTLLPVFLYFPVQQIDGNPNVRLPFKFISGFGADAQTIGIFYAFIGIIGLLVQFYIFPPTAKRYGILNCTKAVSILFPILYLLTPFTALLPASLRQPSIFTIMLLKLVGTIYCFPCILILLTNSATSLRVLATLNGVGTSASAIGRAVGPAIIGAIFSFGVKHAYVIIPWWILCAWAIVSAVPVWWIVETDGFRPVEEDYSDEDEVDAPLDSR